MFITSKKYLKCTCIKMTSALFLSKVLLYITFLISTIHAVDEKSARELPCFNITKTVPLDLNWVGSIKTLYYPLMSRLELYRIAGDLLGMETEDLQENSLYYDSCIYWNMYTNGTIISRGFNGRSREYSTKVLTPNMEKFEFWPNEGKGYAGTVYTTMTDNKTFLFTPFCTKDGEMAWGLGSTLPSLPKQTLKKVMEHAKSLGFKKQFFTGLKYDYCNLGESGNANMIEEDIQEITTTENSSIDITEVPQ